MNPITAKDVKALQKSRQKSPRYVAPALLFAMAVLYLVGGLLSLRWCARIARYDGMALSDVFYGWIQGVDITASYSGIYLAALERLSTAALYLGMVVPFVILGWVAIVTNRRNRRIIDYIEAKEREAR